MKKLLPVIFIFLLQGCISPDTVIHYEEPTSEYEQGLAYCRSKPSEDFVNLCKFHWQLAYAEKYTLAWQNDPFNVIKH